MAEDTVPTSLLHPAARHMPEWTLHWLFRLALCGEFVGHGAFGVMTKQDWVPYFTLFGFPEAWAWRLMPVVGSIDITLGFLALLAPMRAGLLGAVYRRAPPARGRKRVGVSGAVL